MRTDQETKLIRQFPVLKLNLHTLENQLHKLVEWLLKSDFTRFISLHKCRIGIRVIRAKEK